MNLVQSLSQVWLLASLWTAALQDSLSITSFWRVLRLMSIESVMPSNHVILCCPLLLLPSIFPSIRVFSNESVLCIRWPKYWSFSSWVSLYGKMQESGLTVIIPFICISAAWGQYLTFLHILSLPQGVAAARWQVLFSIPGALSARKFTFGGLESLMTMTSLLTDMAGNTPFLTSISA